MYSRVVKTQSAKICLNLNFWGGGVFLGSQNSKYLALPKFEFSGGDVFLGSKTRKCQDLPEFEWGGGGGGWVDGCILG